jgi:hypothetical protein
MPQHHFVQLSARPHAVTVPLAALLGAALLVLTSVPAIAADAKTAIAIELEMPSNLQPTHLCVITARGSQAQPRAGGAGGSADPSSLHASLPLGSLGKVLRVDEHGVPRFIPLGQMPRSMADALTTLPRLREALESLTTTETSSDCTKDYGACAPTLGIAQTREWFNLDTSEKREESLHVTCGSNSATVSKTGPVLFVSLNFIQTRDLAISKIVLDGTIGSLVLRGRVSPAEEAVARVVGGHYLPGRSHPLVGNRLVLPVEPLCAVRRIPIPRVAGLEAVASALQLFRSNPAQPIHTCAPRAGDGHIDVRLPNTVEAVAHQLVWKVGTGAQLEGQWNGHRPPDDLALRFKRFDFSWKPDCTYPMAPDGGAKACPQTEVAGVVCAAASDAGQCRYSCQTDGSFTLPAAVAFRARGSTDRWTGRLEAPGQELSDYVAPHERRVRVHFPAWRRLAMGLRTRVRGVELSFPSGEHRFIETPWTSQKLDREIIVDRLACDQAVAYRFAGVGTWVEDQEIRLADGQLEIPSPECHGPLSALLTWGKKAEQQSLCMKMRARVGAEVMARAGSHPMVGRGVGQGFAVTGDFTSVDSLGEGAQFYEFGYRATLGSREYLVPSIQGPELSAAAYGRLAYEVAAGVRTPNMAPLIPELAIGVGVGVGYGHVLQGGRARALGGDVVLVPKAFLQVGRAALAVRWVLGEELEEIDEAGQSIGQRDVGYLGIELRVHSDLGFN